MRLSTTHMSSMICTGWCNGSSFTIGPRRMFLVTCDAAAMNTSWFGAMHRSEPWCSARWKPANPASSAILIRSSRSFNNCGVDVPGMSSMWSKMPNVGLPMDECSPRCCARRGATRFRDRGTSSDHQAHQSHSGDRPGVIDQRDQAGDGDEQPHGANCQRVDRRVAHALQKCEVAEQATSPSSTGRQGASHPEPCTSRMGGQWFCKIGHGLPLRCWRTMSTPTDVGRTARG